ncbi:MAG: hypothetical protein JNK10_15785, partial [Cyclobacteriaceae bacterium]|nr:hypothetical protein [Cyclobacteriaceae bacterium]
MVLGRDRVDRAGLVQQIPPDSEKRGLADQVRCYYEKKDYYRTAILFEEILPIVRGLPEGEKVEFYLAYCQYYERQYLLASNQFRTFYETYGRSSFAQEAFFMFAYSLYVSSPDSNLDQTSTVEGMNAMQNFIN